MNATQTLSHSAPLPFPHSLIFYLPRSFSTEDANKLFPFLTTARPFGGIRYSQDRRDNKGERRENEEIRGVLGDSGRCGNREEHRKGEARGGRGRLISECHSRTSDLSFHPFYTISMLRLYLLALLISLHLAWGWSPRLSYRNFRGPGGSLQLLLQTLNITDTDHGGKGTPCCMDTLGSGVCKSMARRSPDRFLHQCRTNADFSFIQCCATCHFGIDVQLKGIDERATLAGREFPTPESLYDHDVDRMLQSKTAQCIDRRTARFCEALVTQKYSELCDSEDQCNVWLNNRADIFDCEESVRISYPSELGQSQQINSLVNKSSSRVIGIYKGMPSGYKDLKSLMGGIDLLRDAPCESSALAFRVCRKTCGYCAKDRARAIVKFNADVSRNPNICQTLY